MKKYLNKKTLLIVLGVFLLLTVTYTTIAYLANESTIDNSFIPGVVRSNVNEEFNNIVKRNVSIKNNGNVKEYIRVFINVYYKNSSGVVLSDVPVKDVDYSLTLSSSTNWLYNSSDGFYYYKMPVDPNTDTDILITECTELINHMGKIFNVDILSQSIQAEPESAVSFSWGVTTNNGNIVIGA